MTLRRKVIVNLGGKGDIVNTTMFPKLYKEFGYDEVVWITFRRNLEILDGNPHINRLVAAEDILNSSFFENSNNIISTAVLRAQLEKSSFDTAYPAPYCHPEYDGSPTIPLLEFIQKNIKAEFNIEKNINLIQVPQVYLSDENIREARSFFETLPKQKKILLVEHESFSNQTYMNTDSLLTLARTLRQEYPELFFVFTGMTRLSEDGIISYNGSYKSNCELYNLCDGFFSISSGIGCLIHSDYCNNDKPILEFVLGQHWSSQHYEHKKEKSIIYHRDSVLETARQLVKKLGL